MATHSDILAWRIPVNRGAWQTTVHGVAKSWTRLSLSCGPFTTEFFINNYAAVGILDTSSMNLSFSLKKCLTFYSPCFFSPFLFLGNKTYGAYVESERYESDSKAGIVLVCHRDGQRVLSYRGAWIAACQRAGVQMRPYDIRHLAATVMLGAGADLAAVAAQLGHSNVATTGATYAHVTAGAQARAAALMPEIDDGDTKVIQN